MTIDEAIEILEKDNANPGIGCIVGGYEARKLGIEALKRLKEQRKAPECADFSLLPGETR